LSSISEVNLILRISFSVKSFKASYTAIHFSVTLILGFFLSQINSIYCLVFEDKLGIIQGLVEGLQIQASAKALTKLTSLNLGFG